MTAVPIALQSNPGKYSFSGSTRLINAYAEKQDGKQPMAVMPCYGLTLFAEVTDTPCRGTIFLDDLGVAYSAHSTGIWKVQSDGTSTRIGTLPGTDIVQFSRNQAEFPQIVVHCNAGDFYIQNDVITQITDTDLPTPVTQDHLSGYTVYGLEDRRVFVSGLNDAASIDSTDYATAEQSADPLVRVKADHGDLFIFKQKTTEVWRNTGNEDFPFEPIIPATIQKGLISKSAVIECDNTLMFPAPDHIVYRLNGYTPQRISTHSVERAIEADGNHAAIVGFSYSAGGHSFATLTGDTYTKVFDAATGLWHDRESYGQSHWRARFPFHGWNKNIIGDTLSGNLYEIDRNAFDEGGEPLVWGMDTPTIHAFPNGGIIDAVFIDMQTGVGNLPASADGYDPVLMLDWSVDGGKTFRGARQLKLGKWGEYVRVSTRRLGRFGEKGVMFRLRVSDPVIRAIIAMDISVRPLKK